MSLVQVCGLYMSPQRKWSTDMNLLLVEENISSNYDRRVGHMTSAVIKWKL